VEVLQTRLRDLLHRRVPDVIFLALQIKIPGVQRIKTLAKVCREELTIQKAIPVAVREQENMSVAVINLQHRQFAGME